MKKTNLFIVREYLLCDDYGGIRIDEEVVYQSFDEAKKYIETLWDKECKGSALLRFRTEIVEYKIGDVESYSRMWIYNLRGDLIGTFPSKDIEKSNLLNYTGKYSVGEIVYIVPRIENELSPSVDGTHGVVYEARLKKKGRPTSGEYIVWHVGEKGMFNHWHVVESVLSKPKTPIPVEDKFVEIFSKYLKKEIYLPEELALEILSETVFVKNSKVFDFERLTLING